MKYNTFSSLLLLVFFITPFFGQAQKLPCLTHSMTNAILEADPEKRAIQEQLERETQEYMALPANQRAGGLKIIPTVVHVIHNNGSENLSKQTILNAIEAANEELRAQNPNISSVVSEFQSVIGDPQFELRLAKIDHQGNCTDGITRTLSALTEGAGENVKDLINWNGGTRRYLQVWLVQSVGSGAGGYTYLPGTNGAESNGIIIRAAQFQGSLAHEFGHWMNLRHTWGPTNDPEESSNCNFDDGVSDTPNTVGVLGGCNTSQESCGSLDNIQNHMDYSGCARMFTAGQAARMQAASESGTGERNYYWGNTNRVQTGTNDGFDPPACVPNVSFALDENLGCEGLVVEFDDVLWGADEDNTWEWNWSFPGGTPSTSNDPNPTVTYNTAGVYDVTLTVNTGAGSDSETIQNAVTVTQFGGGIEANYQEGIENSDFPGNPDPDYEWSIETPGGLTWQRNTTAAFTGDASVRINLRSITEGVQNSLISPPIDMSNVETGDAFMTFRYAHANRNSTDHDEELRIYASRNCGETWTLRYTEDGDGLNTAGANVTSTFVPNANQWREEQVSLATMAGEEHVIIKFEATSDKQSYLYIDDININPNVSGLGVKEIETLTNAVVYPNPIDGTSQLEIRLTEAGSFNLTLVNVVGQQLAAVTRNLTAGVNRISLYAFDTNLNAGFYFIRINSEEGQKTVRFVKN
ncbi:MAG: T9SS type A sorting domain-containing protein [Flavobacteriales bacterium]|nr:T9SS type A sorting domain-containing protein [Flavobacteriales bacterium]